MKNLKLLRDPLLHFVVASVVLFGGYELINRGQMNLPATDPIHIGEGDIRWLTDTFANQWQRPPAAVANVCFARLISDGINAEGNVLIRRQLSSRDQ